MTRGGAILASLLVTMGRPSWWLLALAAFLVRGGFVLFVLPIVLLPSPLAISNMVGPLIIPVALGRVGPEAIAAAALAVAALLGWLLVSGWIAAATELTLIREHAAAAVEEGIGGGSSAAVPRDLVLIARIAVARFLAWLPLGVAIAIGTARIVGITYVELTRPDSVTTSLPLRVALGAAPQLVAVAVAWLLGELIGGLAGRRVVLGGLPAGRALRTAATEVIRRPASTLLPWLLTTGFLMVILGGAVGAGSLAWSRVIVALSDRVVDPLIVAVDLFLFVAIWLAALALTGLCAAIRGSVQTFEDFRQGSTTGTFGAPGHHRPGDWSIPHEGGSL